MLYLSFSNWSGVYATRPLSEAVEQRNVIKHLTHIEDLVITKYAAGAKEALSTLRGFSSYLRGHADAPINVTVKVDGAPAIVVGIDPADKKFFIGTKGAFAKTPRIAKSPDDLKKLYGQSPGLLSTMTVAFDTMKGMTFPHILQGDVLFTPDIKQQQTIDGMSYLTFQPNTIVYGVPTNSSLGKTFATAKFGVCFHTTYTGDSLQTLRAESGADTTELRAPASVALISSRYQDMSGVLTFTASESSALKTLIATITSRTTGLTQNTFLRALKDIPLLQSEFMIFQNSLVRGGESITLSPKVFVLRLITHLGARALADVLTKSTAAGKASSVSKYAILRDLVVQQESALVAILAWQQSVIDAKLFLLAKLNQHGRIGTFYATDGGLTSGQHEGFVAVDRQGNFVKLVNRADFSRMNLTGGRFGNPA